MAVELNGLNLRTDRKLRDSWRNLYRTEPPKKIARSLLIQGIGYRMQENAMGGLKSSTRRLLMRAAASVADGREPRRRLQPPRALTHDFVTESRPVASRKLLPGSGAAGWWRRW